MTCPHCGARISQKVLAQHLGSAGGKAIAKRGPEYFRQLQAKRKVRKGGFWKGPKA